MGNENRKCIVKHYFYNFYYCGKEIYEGDFSRVEFFDFEKLPSDVRNNIRNEIIFLDTEKGLGLLIEEIEKLQNKIKQEDNPDKVKSMKNSLEKMYNSNPEMIDKYNSEHTKYPSINSFSPERKRLIIKEIVLGKKIIPNID